MNRLSTSDRNLTGSSPSFRFCPPNGFLLISLSLFGVLPALGVGDLGTLAYPDVNKSLLERT